MVLILYDICKRPLALPCLETGKICQENDQYRICKIAFLEKKEPDYNTDWQFLDVFCFLMPWPPNSHHLMDYAIPDQEILDIINTIVKTLTLLDASIEANSPFMLPRWTSLELFNNAFVVILSCGVFGLATKQLGHYFHFFFPICNNRLRLHLHFLLWGWQ